MLGIRFQWDTFCHPKFWCTLKFSTLATGLVIYNITYHATTTYVVLYKWFYQAALHKIITLEIITGKSALLAKFPKDIPLTEWSLGYRTSLAAVDCSWHLNVFLTRPGAYRTFNANVPRAILLVQFHLFVACKRTSSVTKCPLPAIATSSRIINRSFCTKHSSWLRSHTLRCCSTPTDIYESLEI